MNPLTYIISNNGLGIAIGIVGDKQLAHRDVTLAENVYGSNHSDHLFASLLYMPSVQQFKKFIILKEYYAIWDKHWSRNKVSGSKNTPNVMQFTRRAIKQGNLIMESRVTYEDFMRKIGMSSHQYGISNKQTNESNED
jgi:hypothetical protein